MKSKLSPNNCITCGVDLNRCADKDLVNNQCGFCSPKKPLKEITIDGKKCEVKSTISWITLFSVISTLLVSLAIWQTGVENLAIWMMGVFIITFIIWSKILNSFYIKPITSEIEGNVK